MMVRELGVNGICLRASVMTNTVEENFGACSDLRRRIVYRFKAEPDIQFANTNVQIVDHFSDMIE